jgi:hypothetical protein
MSPDPESAAMQLAIDPSLISLDQAISAIRSWQAQTDAQINTLLAENKELREALKALRDQPDLSDNMRRADAAIEEADAKSLSAHMDSLARFGQQATAGEN